MKIKIILCMLLITLSLTACSNHKDEKRENEIAQDIGDTKKDDEAIDINMTVYDKDKNVIDIYKDDSLVYSGQPFEFYVKVENCADFPVTICLLALTKSSLQPFVMVDSSEEVMSCRAQLKGKESQEFHMYVTPAEVYSDRVTLIQYMLYTTKGIEVAKSDEGAASTASTMSQIAVRAKGKDYEIRPDRPMEIKAEAMENTDSESSSLGIISRMDDKWIYPPTDIRLSKGQQIYVSALGTDGNKEGETKYMILVFVDANLIKAFDGKYERIFDKKEYTMNYFVIDNEALPTTGEHQISAMVVPVEYKDEDAYEKMDLINQRRYWVILGNEGIFTFK